jgi:hypothetical protein
MAPHEMRHRAPCSDAQLLRSVGSPLILCGRGRGRGGASHFDGSGSHIRGSTIAAHGSHLHGVSVTVCPLDVWRAAAWIRMTTCCDGRAKAYEHEQEPLIHDGYPQPEVRSSRQSWARQTAEIRTTSPSDFEAGNLANAPANGAGSSNMAIPHPHTRQRCRFTYVVETAQRHWTTSVAYPNDLAALPIESGGTSQPKAKGRRLPNSRPRGGHCKTET